MSHGTRVALSRGQMIAVALWSMSDHGRAVVCRELLGADHVTVEVLYNGVRFLSGSFTDPDAAFAFADHLEQHWHRRCRVRRRGAINRTQRPPELNVSVH